MWYAVTATALNLRSRPVVLPSTRIAVLPQGQLVLEVGPSTTPHWLEVETTLGGTTFRGHVHGDHLEAAAAPPSPAGPVAPGGHRPPPVHLAPPKGERANEAARAFPLGEPSMPAPHDPASPASEKIAALHANVAWLGAPASARYRPGGGATFCNVYAYDYATLAGAYLPRVWWMDRALGEIARGNVPPVRYGDTVRELNANSLHDWLVEWGGAYGWQRLATADDAQRAANVGQAVVVCAQRTDLSRSGHIAAIVPEPDAPGGAAAVRSRGLVTKPLLCQAGTRNFNYEANGFFTGAQFRAFGFWGWG